MKKFYLLTLLIFTTILVSCGSDDEYSDTNSEDLQAPTAPTNLMATNVSENSVTLTWAAATDNVAVTGYKLFQDGVEVNNSISGTSTMVDNLMADTEYQFTVTAFDAANNQSAVSDATAVLTLEQPLSFRPTLSEMGIFAGELNNLTPATGVQLYELNTTLYTDYSTKQRLIKLPRDGSMQSNGDLLPNFPDETLIAKTFFYNIDDRDPSLGKQIIETRILIKKNGTWEVGDYIWNDSQTEAALDASGMGGTRNITFINSDGETQTIEEYKIPSTQDCFTCHNNNGATFPIGPKLRSMNFVPSYTTQNQLDFFTANGLLDGAEASSISVLPDWTDINLDINDRGRAYLDMNCAHCHSPGGNGGDIATMDLRLETAYEDTDIYDKRFSIEARFTTPGIPEYSMPLLGVSELHEEALDMLMVYLAQLEEPN